MEKCSKINGQLPLGVDGEISSDPGGHSRQSNLDLAGWTLSLFLFIQLYIASRHLVRILATSLGQPYTTGYHPHMFTSHPSLSKDFTQKLHVYVKEAASEPEQRPKGMIVPHLLTPTEGSQGEMRRNAIKQCLLASTPKADSEGYHGHWNQEPLVVQWTKVLLK